MGILQKYRAFVDHWNGEGDDISDGFIHNEYFGLLPLAALYGNVKKYGFVLCMCQALLYLGILGYYSGLLLITGVRCLTVNFVFFSQSIHYMLMGVLSFVFIVFFNYHRRKIARVHRSVALNFYDYKENDSLAQEKAQKYLRKERMYFLSLPAMVFISSTMIIVVAPNLDQLGTFDFSETVSGVNYNQPVPLWYPFYTKDGWAYWGAAFGQMCMATVIALSSGSAGFIHVVLEQNIAAQLEVLIDSLVHIETRALDLYEQTYGERPTRVGHELYRDGLFMKCYNISLNRNIEHHQIILRSWRDVTDIWFVPLFASYSVCTLAISLSFLCITYGSVLPGTTLAALSTCIAETGLIALHSYTGQRITDLSSDFREMIYNMKWYWCSEDIKRSIKIIQTATLEPMCMYGLGIVPANFITFSKVMNSAYSYYNLVTAFQREED